MSLSVMFTGAQDGDDGPFQLASASGWSLLSEYLSHDPGLKIHPLSSLRELVTAGETKGSQRLAVDVVKAMSVIEEVPMTVRQKILAMLSDGRPHTREELRGCLWDELGTNDTVRHHIGQLRRELLLKGEDIVCRQSNGPLCYQHVKLLDSSAVEPI